jgi:hypothetical protein
MDGATPKIDVLPHRGNVTIDALHGRDESRVGGERSEQGIRRGNIDSRMAASIARSKVAKATGRSPRMMCSGACWFSGRVPGGERYAVAANRNRLTGPSTRE